MFHKPAVGSVITITTRYPDYYYYRTQDFKDTVYENVAVLPPPYKLNPDQICISGDARMPFRVISMKNVVEMTNGIASEVTTTKTVEVTGKKGATYYVTVVDGHPESCTCPGFTYRKTCRHLGEVETLLTKNPKLSKVPPTGADPSYSKTMRKGNMKSKSLNWNERFAILDHYKPNDDAACQAFGVTQAELDTARDLRSAGTFSAAANIDVESYGAMFSAPANDTATSTKAPARKANATTVAKPDADTTPRTASKPIKTPKKRGRKGDKIKNAFAAISTTPVAAEQFAKDHNVSLAVLRQSKRFQPEDITGTVRVKKVELNGVKTLAIWKEV